MGDDPGVNVRNLRLDFGERMFFEGRGAMRKSEDRLRNNARLVLLALTGNPIRKLLFAEEALRARGAELSRRDPKVYALPQFAGAIDTILAGLNLVCDGFPFETNAMFRRAYETAVTALYYVDNPAAYDSMLENQRPPKLSKTRDAFKARGKKLLKGGPLAEEGNVDAEAFEELYDKLSNDTHSGPGVRLIANFTEGRLRIGAVDPSGDFTLYRKAFDALRLAAELVGATMSIAFEREFAEATARGEVQRMPLGDLANLRGLAAR